MSDNNRSLEPLTTFSFEASDDVVSADFFRKGTPSRRDSRKAKQLCRQVAETLDLVLSGDSRDDLIQRLHVMLISPETNTLASSPRT